MKILRLKKQVLITMIAVLVLVVSMIGGSYALFSNSSNSGEFNFVEAGNLEISYVEGENGAGDVLSLNGEYPQASPTTLSDLEKLSVYRFNVTNTGNAPIDYIIKVEYDDAIIAADNCSNNLLDFQYVRYNFDKQIDENDNNKPISNLLSSNNEHIVYDSKAANQPGLVSGGSMIHEIRLWIDSNAPNSVLGKHFHAKVVVEAIQSGMDRSLLTPYTVGQSVTLLDDSTWHVIKNAGKSSATVTLLKDTNVAVGEGTTIAFDTENLRPTSSNSYCINDSFGCNMYKANNSTVITDASIKTWLEQTYLPSLKAVLEDIDGSELEDLTVTLPTMEQLIKANNSSDNFNQAEYTFSNTSATSYLTSSKYWTKTASKLNTTYVWYIDSENNKSAVANANKASEIGVRPVITTSKINIKSVN